MYEDVLRRFHCQYVEGDCFPTSIYNILIYYSTELDAPRAFRLSKSDINDLCGFSSFAGTPKNIDFIANGFQSYLKDEFPRLKINVNYSQDKEMDLKDLMDICKDELASFPLVTLSHEYFKDKSVKYKVDGKEISDHTVSVINVVKRYVIIHDPRECFRSSDVTCNETIKKLPSARFLRYWDRAEFRYEILWFGKMKHPELYRFDEDRIKK